MRVWVAQSHRYEQRGATDSSLREAVAAVDALEQKVYDELRRYEALCERHSDGPDWFRLQMTRAWLESEGKHVLASLKRKIQAADATTRTDMIAAFRAAIASGDAAARRDMSLALHRDMLWEWADQIISSMEVAFRRFPEEPVKDDDVLVVPGVEVSSVASDWTRQEIDGRRPYEPIKDEFSSRTGGIAHAA